MAYTGLGVCSVVPEMGFPFKIEGMKGNEMKEDNKNWLM